MSTLLKSSPFAALLVSAAAAPKETGLVARYQRRLDGPGAGHVVVADVSSSMAEAAGKRSKIAVLREALGTIPPGARLIAFATKAQEIESAAGLPFPMGSTALHLALDIVATFTPKRTLVISDGHPDSEEKAFLAAEKVSGAIDVLYCGPEDDARAQSFLRRLARAGAGRYETHDMRRPVAELGGVVRTLLGSGR